MRSAWTGPSLYGQLHASGDEDLARLRTAGAPAPGYAIPRPPGREAAGSAAAVVLDPELIKARLAESARAASYLAQIFTDDDTGSQAAVPTGLDTAAEIRMAVPPVWMHRTAPS